MKFLREVYSEARGGLMCKNEKETICSLAIFTVVILLFSWFLLICCNYPYYFIWDMDHITALDTMIIQSDMLPDQICHPSFGMYLTLFFTEKIGYYFNLLSALNLKDLYNSLNPLAAMAELTSFIRQWNRYGKSMD